MLNKISEIFPFFLGKISPMEKTQFSLPLKLKVLGVFCRSVQAFQQFMHFGF
jgi:hypothetical protein